LYQTKRGRGREAVAYGGKGRPGQAERDEVEGGMEAGRRRRQSSGGHKHQKKEGKMRTNQTS
jgi:hypothetical protein